MLIYVKKERHPPTGGCFFLIVFRLLKNLTTGSSPLIPLQAGTIRDKLIIINKLIIDFVHIYFVISTSPTGYKVQSV